MNTQVGLDFNAYLAFFPELALPASLLPDLHRIPADGTPVPGSLVDAFILPFEADEMDSEFTEYVPYGRLTGTSGYQAIIYWKAGVLRYEFILATYTTDGAPLSHAIIGGLRYEDEGALHSVAVIQPDFHIAIAEGLLQEGDAGAGEATQTYHMMITPEGIITYETNEEETK